ncbi:MAG: hypothetical protein GY797_13900 [Deltaproteobacteria bacterium]|nr:hypothetical protein [Deltaproteobacteria bacterium]
MSELREWEQEWEQEKQDYIKILNHTNGVIDEILRLDLKGSIIDDDAERSIKDKRQKLAIYLDKLQSNRFELAIVGLEKAGKSTFANALISNNIRLSDNSRDIKNIVQTYSSKTCISFQIKINSLV